MQLPSSVSISRIISTVNHYFKQLFLLLFKFMELVSNIYLINSDKNVWLICALIILKL